MRQRTSPLGHHPTKWHSGLWQPKSASESATKFSTSVRNVFRWNALARERGLV
jgi:hypothetical protein